MPKRDPLVHRSRPEAELKQRATMLRGIYEDNLRLTEPGHHSPQRTQAPKRAMWGAIAAIALLIGAAGPLDRAVRWAVPSQSTLSRTAPQESAAHPANNTNTLAASDSDALPPSATPVPPRLPPSAAPPHVFEAVEPVRAAATNAPGAPRPSVAQPLDLPIRTIVIDAGHGDRDTGSIGKAGVREKDITLDIARRLKEKLAYRPEYRVFLVRDSDSFIPLNERVGYVNSLETDLFISIHVDDLPGTSTDTVGIYYFGRSQDIRTRRLAQLENQYWSYTIGEYEERMQTPMKVEGSKALADSIQASFLGNQQGGNRIVPKTVVGAAALVVLLGVKAPSVVVEIGTLSTREGERRLGQVQYRDNIVAYLAAGITAYLSDQPRQ